MANLSGKFTTDGKLTPQGSEFVENYGWTVNKILNDHHSYCQNAMKDACIAWMKDNKKEKLPSNEEFMKILTRDPGVDKKLFAWWWETYMPKATGNQKIWNEKNKYFGNLSTHCPPGMPRDVFITPSTEAWGMLLIMNCRERWPKIMQLKKASSARITYTKGGKASHKAGTTIVDVRTEPDFLGVYTRSDAGQKKFGGWSAEGLKKYKELVQLNKEGRAKDTTPALEAEVLAQLRMNNGIVGDNWEDHKKAASGDDTAVAAHAEVDGLFDMDEITDMEVI
jgi:hypothetical protein